MTRYGETEADDLFRAQAERDGYLKPGGQGLWAWYRDNGMLPPEVARKVVEREFIGADLERMDVGTARLDGSYRTPGHESHTKTEDTDAPVSVRLPAESTGLTGRQRTQPDRWHR